MPDTLPLAALPSSSSATLSPLVDPFGRRVSYLRISVTDRCDLRCVYCMSEDTSFLPKSDVLTLEELDRVCSAFVQLGVRKLRLTGGEPLVRRGIMGLIRSLGRHVSSGALHELVLTTNGTALGRYAAELAAAGIRRINVSLDTLDAGKFQHITRWGQLGRVLDGIEAARVAGLAVKINTVAIKGFNDNEFDALVSWCGARGIDLTFIEVMPMGEVGGTIRADQYMPLSAVRTALDARWTLTPNDHSTGGPSRYVTVGETGCRIGFIAPMSHNFCESCNRVRLTCTGTLYLCLGRQDAVDLRAPLRIHPSVTDDADLLAAIRNAVARKPQGHDFVIDRPTLDRAMNRTGG